MKKGNNGETFCGKTFERRQQDKSVSTGNMEEHLHVHHPEQYKELKKKKATASVQKEKQRSCSSGAGTSAKGSLDALVHQSKPNRSENSKQKQFQEDCATFFSSTSISYNSVRLPAFQDMVHNLDPCIVLPTPVTVCTWAKKIEEKMVQNLKQDLSEASRIFLMADIWSKKGFQASFLGITAAFYSRRSHKRCLVVLSLTEFPHPHTHDRIINEVLATLQHWNIDPSKVLRSVTDNGNNIVIAFTYSFGEADYTPEMVQQKEVKSAD